MKIRKDNGPVPVEFRSLRVGQTILFGDDTLYVKVSLGGINNAALLDCGTLCTFAERQLVFPVQIIEAVVRDAEPF